jgi:hypothetical protein
MELGDNCGGLLLVLILYMKGGREMLDLGGKLNVL